MRLLQVPVWTAVCPAGLCMRNAGLAASMGPRIGSMGVSADTERLARAMFRPEQLHDVLEIIGWYDDVQADEVHRAVLTLSKGDVDALLDLVAAAVTDFRDVLMWASQPEPTPEQRAEARARTRAIARE